MRASPIRTNPHRDTKPLPHLTRRIFVAAARHTCTTAKVGPNKRWTMPLLLLLLLLCVQVQRSLPQLAAKVEALEAQRQAVVIEEEEQVGLRGGGEGGVRDKGRSGRREGRRGEGPWAMARAPLP